MFRARRGRTPAQGLLHLGNVQFTATEDGGCEVEGGSSQAEIAIVAECFGMPDPARLSKELCIERTMMGASSARCCVHFLRAGLLPGAHPAPGPAVGPPRRCDAKIVSTLPSEIVITRNL